MLSCLGFICLSLVSHDTTLFHLLLFLTAAFMVTVLLNMLHQPSHAILKVLFNVLFLFSLASTGFNQDSYVFLPSMIITSLLIISLHITFFTNCLTQLCFLSILSKTQIVSPENSTKPEEVHLELIHL